jgi:tRNA dimethylallyltransferase
MGPTGSGKTDLAVDLVSRLPCDIISVDSAMIYRGMDIGTAKPGPEILADAPHRLIDILDPAESYSTARFRQDALAEMESISAQGRVPLLVGGTMLYFRGLQEGLARLPDADPQVRRALLDEAERIGWAGLHARLARLDPESATRIHPNDPQRIQRALEVHALTGEPLSALIRAASRTPPPFRLLKLVRAPEDRQVLHARIERRFDAMLDQGLVAEVESLWTRGDLSEDMPSMRCVGYRQVLKLLTGEYSFAEMRRRAVYATRQLAKRQLTWLRSEGGAGWLGDTASPLDSGLTLIREALGPGAERPEGHIQGSRKPQ